MADPRALLGQQLVVITEIVTFMSDGHQVCTCVVLWPCLMLLCLAGFSVPLHVNNSSNNYQTEAGS